MPDPLPHLTVAMIVRNAADPLRETLESLAGWPVRFAIVDTGSTDETPSVCRRFGIRPHSQPWNDDFAAARNACLAHVETPWVLWLDAGERLPPATRGALAELLSPPAPLAYLLPVVMPPVPTEIGGEQVYQVRLHPHRPELRFAGRVRETLDAALAAARVSLRQVELPIERGHRDQEPAVRVQRAHRNIRLANLAMSEAGPTAGMENCLAEALQTLGDTRRAMHHYERALELAERQSSDEREAYYGLLTCLESTSPDRQAQLALCMRALERFPLDAQLLIALGGYLRTLGQPALAARAFDVALRHGQSDPRLWHLTNLGQIAAGCAAAAYQELGDLDHARTLLEAALRLFPDSWRLAEQLIQLHLAANRPVEAQHVVASLAAGVREAPAIAQLAARIDAAARLPSAPLHLGSRRPNLSPEGRRAPPKN